MKQRQQLKGDRKQLKGDQQQQACQKHSSRDKPTTVLASAGKQTTQYGRQKLMSFRRNLPKSCQNSEKFVKTEVKKRKNSPCSIGFSNSDSYLTIGSPM
jgi:hypothetical protein